MSETTIKIKYFTSEEELYDEESDMLLGTVVHAASDAHFLEWDVDDHSGDDSRAVGHYSIKFATMAALEAFVLEHWEAMVSGLRLDGHPLYAPTQEHLELVSRLNAELRTGVRRRARREEESATRLLREALG